MPVYYRNWHEHETGVCLESGGTRFSNVGLSKQFWHGSGRKDQQNGRAMHIGVKGSNWGIRILLFLSVYFSPVSCLRCYIFTRIAIV